MNIWKKNIVIVGIGEYALRIKTEIERNITLGYTVVGFIKVDVSFGLGRRREERENEAPFDDKIRVLGNISNLPEISRKYHVYDVIIGLPEISTNRFKILLNSLENVAETIRIIPSTGNVFAWGVEVDKIGDILALSIPQNLMKPWNNVFKFIMEVVIAILSAIVFIPIGIVVSIAIKIDSPGPIFSVQERIGKNRKIFKCYKFRSMYIDEKQRLEAYLDDHPEVQREWDAYQKIKGYDPRVTRVGKIIRKFSLDETAQLINFIKRDMNIIGPRPYLLRETALMLDKANIISRVKPGITGLWQVRGRNNLPFKERLLLDEYYIRNWSIWLDFSIFAKTIKTFITREGAY
jgi:undecaprenyl-phosphate galactose phosphotransferase